MNFELIKNNIPALLSGTWTTIWLVSLALFIGFFIAILTAIASQSDKSWLRLLANTYSYIFRGTPLLIQLYIFYYGVGIFAGSIVWLVDSSLWVLFEHAWPWALLALVLNTGAYTSEIIKGSMRNTPVGEIEASKSMGMSAWQTLYRIILPSAFRRAIPAYGNEIIYMLHGSAMVSFVTIIDITGVARKIANDSYDPYTPYITAALIYLFLTTLIVVFVKLLEKKFLVHLKQAQHKKV